MPPIAGACAGQRQVGRLTRLLEAGNEVGWEKRTIAGHADDVGHLGRVRRRPIEPGKDAGERAGEAWHRVRDDRQAGVAKSGRIAVGIEDHRVTLRRKPRQYALENGLAADPDARLVAAAHAPREPAREHEAEDRRITHGYQPRRVSVIVHRRLAPVLGAFLLDEVEVLVEHDAVLAGECDEAFAARAADQREIRLARKLDAPGGEAGA